jgi:transcriptional regulator with XRE-family HTH domain
MNVSVSDLRALWGEKGHQELERIALATGVPVGTIINVVRGRTKSPRVDTFYKLAAEYERQRAQ